jgi:succinoglycan biosynthesis protein ExoV
VFGSGFGYGELPRIDERWHFHAVRGPYTARALGLPADAAVTDAAVLVRAVMLPPPAAVRSRVGAIFTGQSLAAHDWQAVCAPLGIRFISCHWDVERVMREMRACDVLLCEAMHGAIVADTLRIPWIPVVCYEHISAFKWRDWLSTLELPYAPQRVPSLYDAERHLDGVTRAKNGIKRGLSRAGVQPQGWTPPPPAKTKPALREQAVGALGAAARGRAYLSSDAIVERHMQRYLECLRGLQRQSSGAPPPRLQKQARLHVLPV